MNDIPSDGPVPLRDRAFGASGVAVIHQLEGPDQVLVVVLRLWHEANEADDQANLFEDEARNLRGQADEKREEAEALWKPLIDAHPEWADALRDEVDPRSL